MSVTTTGTIAADNPLFQSTEALAVVIELPVRDVLRHAERRRTVPGLLRFTDADGAEIMLDIELTTRGNSKLEQCSYPPLKLELKRSQVASTAFAGQNKLKLVTQCSGAAASLRYLDQEYIIYRAYNLLSQYSFRVRRLDVTFRDSVGRRRDEVHPGFFIESDSEVAARLGMTPVEATVVDIPQLDAGQLSIFTLFQYMIGNTDWSVLKGTGTEKCCHNGEVIAPPGSDTGWVVLPYDFDQSGVINASYALPRTNCQFDPSANTCIVDSAVATRISGRRLRYSMKSARRSNSYSSIVPTGQRRIKQPSITWKAFSG